MGGGSWTRSVYDSRRERPEEKTAGTAFLYSSSTRSKAASTWAAHDTMKPDLKAGDASPFAGSVMRESRDSDEHPETTPIAVFFDQTGSMHTLPTLLQQKLPNLYGMLLTKGYVEHPQILFGAIGDAFSDRVPLQVGQFESDNRSDENLENLFLEGNGGGGNHESYELAAYFVAKHTATDAWDKRGKKGYLFLIGDERTYSKVDREQVKRIIGDTLPEDIPTKDIFAELQERWEVYFLFATQGSYSEALTLDPGNATADALTWRDILRQNALPLDDAAAVCEAIALTIGLSEGVVADLDAGAADLADVGSDASSIASASRALATVGAGVATSSPGTTDGDLDVSDDAGADRL